MTHILDNPIWNAFNTTNKSLAEGNECAKYCKRSVSAFAGMRNNSEADFESLYALSELNTPVVLFTPGEIPIPANWRINLQKNIIQMVYEGSIPPGESDQPFVALSDKDVPAMVSLADLTKPGPFLSRTIEFGHYEGIFSGDELVAMAGQRMQPDPYTEISAVCTHPDHTGKGYAVTLIRNQVQRILGLSRVPFLHVFLDNPAQHLYRKLGFKDRREMTVYVLQKVVLPA